MVRKARGDCVHEQVAKRIANVRFTVLNSYIWDIKTKRLRKIN